MARIEFNSGGGRQPPAEVVEYVTKIVLADLAQDEKRDGRRHPVSLPVSAVPIDDQFSPKGPEFVAVTRDISTGGISFIHTCPVNDKLLALELVNREGEKIQVVMEVVRCTNSGRYYEVGGRLVAKLT